MEIIKKKKNCLRNDVLKPYLPRSKTYDCARRQHFGLNCGDIIIHTFFMVFRHKNDFTANNFKFIKYKISFGFYYKIYF